jgi:hypothetical protein
MIEDLASYLWLDEELYRLWHRDVEYMTTQRFHELLALGREIDEQRLLNGWDVTTIEYCNDTLVLHDVAYHK